MEATVPPHACTLSLKSTQHTTISSRYSCEILRPSCAIWNTFCEKDVSVPAAAVVHSMRGGATHGAAGVAGGGVSVVRGGHVPLVHRGVFGSGAGAG